MFEKPNEVPTPADNDSPHREERTTDASSKAPAYETPEIVSHSGEELLKELGPAQACYGFSGD